MLPKKKYDIEIYITLVEEQTSRLFSRLDREAISPTFGSFDRVFWSWKFTDFSGSRFQESLYLASWLFNSKKFDEKYYDSNILLKWIEGGFDFWSSLQHKDGSFDEAYPHEKSLAATAFGTFYIGEAYIILKNKIRRNTKTNIKNSLLKAANWLCVNEEKHGFLTNHVAAAAAALIIVWKITKIKKYYDRAFYFLEKIYNHQNTEGWYEEYSGADIGYQSHGSFYLSRIWQITKDEKLLKSLILSFKFFKCFIHPNGSIGGEYGSRNTSFYFPAAFEMLSHVSEDAKSIACYMRSSVSKNFSVGLNSIDSYNFSPMINNYIFAYDNAKYYNTYKKLPFQRLGVWNFSNAGVFVKSSKNYFCIISSSKGGIIKIYSKLNKKNFYSDCGYWGKTISNKTITSQSFCLNHSFKNKKNKIEINIPFVRIKQKIMNPWLFICFRIFSLTFGRNKLFAEKLKILLVKTLLKNNKKISINLTRKFEFYPKGVIIKDKIDGSVNIIKELYSDNKFSTIHMGSSRYFQLDELVDSNLPEAAKLKREFKWKA